MQKWLTTLKGLKRYPTLIAGLVISIIFVAVSIYTLVALPYSEALRLWRGGPGIWDESPRNAAPVWFDLFIEGKVPRTIVVNLENTGTKTEEAIGDGMKRVEIVLPFQYDYDGFPKELRLYTEADYEGQCNVGDWTDIIQVAAGLYHTVGLEIDGTVVAVGGNSYRQGDVAGWTSITQVAAGDTHTVGLKTDGTAVAVGSNNDGQCNVGGWGNIAQVAAGGNHTVGLKSDGTVVAVGRNEYGQCDVGSWTNIIQVAAGVEHTVGIRRDGSVVAVGNNDEGQCDVGWTDISQVAVGSSHTVGLKSDGTVVAVGWNEYGQCDVGGWTDITQVAAARYHTVGLSSNGTVVAMGPGCHYDDSWCNLDSWTDITQVAAGLGHTVGLKSDGTVIAVGADYEGSREPATVSWRTPDGRTIILQENRVLKTEDAYYISQDRELRTQLSGMAPHKGLFVDPNDEEKPLKGEYQLFLTTEVPETAELNAKLVAHGQIHGLAGTDHRGRDLMVALLWGAPIGIMFGVLAAIGAQVSTFVLSAIGTWMGGKIDRLFQWLTQVNLVIPVLPLLILVAHFYSRSIWTMLGMIIALNVFSASYLTYRAMYLQAKEAPYIEAAQAYGASNSRMIFRYLIPRIAPTLLPQFILIIPLFVFLEATLSVLGLGAPGLPTWGKVIYNAVDEGALYKGYYYWLVEPAALLLLLGVGFSLIGYSLDRIFNPRLRSL